jgi:3-methyladenine DNA glycosylase AlkD
MGRTQQRVARKLRALDPLADLRRRLGRGPTRITAPGKIRTVVRAWWRDHALADHPATVGKRIAFALIEQRLVEHKLAGISILQDQLGEHLRSTDIVGFARLFATGHLADWPIVDAFCAKVLATLLERDAGRPDVIYALAQWRSADTAWQRSAACVAFGSLAPRGDAVEPGLSEAILAICASIVWSVDEIDQRAVGWILRELSRAEPDRVEGFFIRYARFMSKACARLAVARYSPARRGALLAHHKNATTI